MTRPSRPTPPPARPAGRRRLRALLLLPALVALVLAAGVLLFRPQLTALLFPPTRLAQLVEAGDAALAAGRLSSADGQGAAELYGAALALDPEHGPARSGLAATARAALQRAQAAVLADHPSAPEALALLERLPTPEAERARLAQDYARRRGAAGSEVAIAGWLEQAQAAMAAGRLDGEEGSALAAYARILALEPRNAVALAGRRGVLDALLAQAEALLAAGDAPAAAILAERVASLEPGHPALPALQALLGEAAAEASRRRARALMESREALAAGRLEDARMGLDSLSRAFPGDTDVAEARRALANAWAERAIARAADFEFEQAGLALASARAVDAAAPSVHLAEQRIDEARARAAALPGTDAPDPARLDALLAAVRAAEGRGALLEPPGDSAWDHLRAAQAIAPGDTRVHAAARRIADGLVRALRADLRGAQLSAAQQRLADLATVAPADPRLAELRREIAARWVGYATERLAAGELEVAREAAEKARALDPAQPALAALEARLQAAGAALR